MTVEMRATSFGQTRPPTPVERFGVWLSAVRIRRYVRDFAGLRVGDFGCGYQARFMRSILDRTAQAVLADVELAPDLKQLAKVTALEGPLPEVLAPLRDGSLDVILAISVLEHLWHPLEALQAFRRLCAPGGLVLINVPSWRGKWFLEFSAFKLGVSVEEMDDHKMYYDPRDLWPLLVHAGFRPSRITVFRHKFGLNTFAVCRNNP